MSDERNGPRPSVEGGSQSSYEAGYTASGLRYPTETYSATGKFNTFFKIF